MTNPFTPPPGGFGFGPADRRALHQQRRHARREFREQLREQRHRTRRRPGLSGQLLALAVASSSASTPAPWASVPAAASVPAVRARWPWSPRRGRGRGRGRRGDVRAAILELLAERPMHGYEMIQEIAERSQGLWRPSPGSVYPTLQLLVDEGLIVATESEGSKKLFELTEDGRAAAEKSRPRRGRRSPRAPTPGSQPAHRCRPADGRRRAVRVHAAREQQTADRRHRQQRPPRDLRHPRRVRITAISRDWSLQRYQPR